MSRISVEVRGNTTAFHCEKLVHHIGALLHDESPALTGIPKYHENVAVAVHTASLQCDDRRHPVHSMNCYKKRLSDVVTEIKQRSSKQKPSDDFYRALFWQTTRGVQHLHEQARSPKFLSADTILFSCDRTSVAITGDVEDYGKNCTKQLGQVFLFVLTEGIKPELGASDPVASDPVASDQDASDPVASDPLASDPDAYDPVDREILVCADKDIAGDLIDKMLQEKLQMNEILEHPFFWSDLQKIAFIADAFDSIKKEGSLSDEERLELDEDPLNIVDGDWTEELKIKPHEKTAILAISGAPKQISLTIIQDRARQTSRITSGHVYYSQESNKPFKTFSDIQSGELLSLSQNNIDQNYFQAVKTAAIKETKAQNIEVFILREAVCIRRPEKAVYDKKSLYELLRFFRNCKAHYWEMTKNLRICFQMYPNGFWQFFSDRYPKLLCYLCEKRMSFSFFDSYKNFTVENEIIPAL